MTMGFTNILYYQWYTVWFPVANLFIFSCDYYNKLLIQNHIRLRSQVYLYVTSYGYVSTSWFVIYGHIYDRILHIMTIYHAVTTTQNWCLPPYKQVQLSKLSPNTTGAHVFKPLKNMVKPICVHWYHEIPFNNARGTLY